MTIKFCPKCGQKLEGEVKFCPKCGQAVTDDKSQTTPPNGTSTTSVRPENPAGIFNTKGRLNRRPYCIQAIVLSVILFFMYVISDEMDDSIINAIGFVIVLAYIAASFMNGKLRAWHKMHPAVNKILAGCVAIFAIFDHVFKVVDTTDMFGAVGFIVLVIIMAVTAAALVALTIRRCHDLNISGWMAVVLFIPAVGAIFQIYLMAAPGKVGSNDYGLDPLEENH